MELPDYPHVLFGQSPLALVVGQVRFSPQPGFTEGTALAAFAKRLRTDYPKSERIEQLQLSVSPMHGMEHQAGPMLWKFSSVDDNWSAVLAENALTLEVRGGYSSINEFLKRFSSLLDHLIEELDPGLQTRVGLRYIDEFRYDEASTITDWATLIRPEFLGFAVMAEGLFGNSSISHTRQQIEVTRPDGTLMIRHGLLSGTSVEPIADRPPQQGRFYLLDMDYYNVQPQRIDRTEVITTMQRYNDTLYRFFRWIMLDKLYESLEPQK